ncbi:PilC/PilY family type IV pilus protein [Ramlibacter sp.]|uniref:PilC/PilY family type IV pilus protein n=1 Tax=Ramlibacter sp. TaxID=1917967 RepID=UPI0035AF903A
MPRLQSLVKLLLGALALGGNVAVLHAQIAQDPLLSRTAAVEPNIVFIFDNSGSMEGTAIYQHGASSHAYGASGPNNDCGSVSDDGCDFRWKDFPPPSPYGRSPDTNRMYYDPRLTYTRQINFDGTFKAAGDASLISSFNVYFYKPPSALSYSVTSVPVTNGGSGYPAGVTVSFPTPPGAGVRATGTVNLATVNRVTSVNISSGGNYPSSGTINVTFSGGGGSGAAGTVNTTSLGRGVASVANPGTPPTFPNNGNSCTITFTGGGGTGATGTAVRRTGTGNQRIQSFTITNPGYGYTSTPLASVTCGSPATTRTGYVVTRTTGNQRAVTSVTMTNNGTGYTSAPTVTFTTPSAGTVATGTAVTAPTTVVSSISITNPGSGYTACPVATLGNTSPGGGATLGTTVCSSVAATVQNQKWDGTGTPTTTASYFTPGWTPLSSDLATGASVIAYPNTANSTTTQYPKFRNRTDCVANAAYCTWAEERQNYANWKEYHSTRYKLAKTGIGLAFQPLDPTFRLGWGRISALGGSASTLDKGVRRYDSTVQKEFLDWLYGITGTSSTPNLATVNRMGQYYQRQDNNGPWADSPTGNGSITDSGSANNNHASCRRSYGMLMTDGYYTDSITLSDVDSANGPLITSPSSYQYTPVGPYSDGNGITRSNTFADIAMKYWVNDLRPDLPNNVAPTASDEAFWQHMNFFAIGLGVTGTLNNADPAVLQSLTGNGAARTLNWPNAPAASSRSAIDDMWHATINGRGSLLNASRADELNEAITKMMSDISGREGTQSGVAVSATSLTRGTKKYTPSYTPVTWNGNVTAYTLDESTGAQNGIAWQIETLTYTDPTTGARTYSSIMPDHAQRRIAVGNGATSGARAVNFTFADMGSLTSQMNGTVNANLINYLRGDASKEDTSSTSSDPTAIYRPRLTRLGDIVNSTPVYVKDSLDMNYQLLPSSVPGYSSYRSFVGLKQARAEGVIFVGGNDGMLHAFRDGTYDATTQATLTPGGIEVFAYVPHAVLGTLNQLADKAYVHRYYVDGPLTEHDAYISGGWKNIVIGTTGAGAGIASGGGTSPRAGVFAIDVTGINSSPTNITASNVLWEINSSQAAFSQLGHVLTDVQTGVTLDGTWVAIFGNGYESAACTARLFVVNLATGALIREINTASGACSSGNRNGLGGIRVVRNANQQVIGVYAGDLRGNMWKFNLNNASPASWGVDLGGQPLYAAGANQPITAIPSVLPLPILGTTDPKPGYMVVFGTGKFFEVADINTTAQQTLYGVWDSAEFGASVYTGVPLTSNSLLVQQTVSTGVVAPNGNTYFSISTNDVPYTGATPKRGWYINFPNSGQRLVYPLDLLASRFAVADTISPTNVSLDPCANTSGGTGYLYIVDALNGAGPTEAILDTNGDGNVDTSDLIVSGIEGKADGRNVNLLVSKNELVTTYANVSGGDPGATLISLSCRLTNTCIVPASGGTRRQWRQLFLR